MLLAKHEIEVMEYLCGGLTAPQIAEIKHKSTATIKSVMHNIYFKFGLNSSTGASGQKIKAVLLYLSKYKRIERLEPYLHQMM